MKKSLYDQLSRTENLKDAWRVVYANGIKSLSDESREQVKNFNIDIENSRNKIAKRLRENKYKFSPAKAVLIKRPGKAYRPLVVPNLKDRIVQRALLNVLQSVDRLKDELEVPTSFGGIGGRSVRGAIEMAYSSVKAGAEYYVRSDIEGFFTKIPRIKILAKINSLLPDASLKNILDDASKTELENLSSLGRRAELFPDIYTGVPQGCSLSPLFGNILLHEFDQKLNTEDITCLRYIDDFIILGPTERDVNTFFRKAQTILKAHGLTAYVPKKGSSKAQKGKVIKGFDFLGCTISTSLIRPNRKARAAIKEKVRDVLRKNASALSSIESRRWDKNHSFVSTLQKINNILMGWGNQYSFCNATSIFKDIDRGIDEFLKEYFGRYDKWRKKFKKSASVDSARKLLGVHLLHESKYAPIITGSP